MFSQHGEHHRQLEFSLRHVICRMWISHCILNKRWISSLTSERTATSKRLGDLYDFKIIPLANHRFRYRYHIDGLAVGGNVKSGVPKFGSFVIFRKTSGFDVTGDRSRETS